MLPLMLYMSKLGYPVLTGPQIAMAWLELRNSIANLIVVHWRDNISLFPK